MQKILIANRGEIALRIARTAEDLSLETVAVHPADDAASLHVLAAAESRVLPGQGPAAYLDCAALIDVARESGADALHPGYGFLSESAVLARACAEAGLVFIGPDPEALERLGDKLVARALARDLDIPVLAGTQGATDLARAQAFLAGLGEGGAVMIKAVAGGGGRGMRPVADAAALEEAMTRSRSEAEAAFGNGDLYLEQFMPRARHVEVQILGDARGAVAVLGDRDCSLQRRHQKILEIGPAPHLDDALRRALSEDARRLGEAVAYRGAGTIEFLVGEDGSYAFIEANPRLQVEHTVTEEVTGLDIVALQIAVARGATLADMGLSADTIPPARGFCIQARLNMESMTASGEARPAGGQITLYEPPTGPGIRVDGFGYTGYRTSPRYDSLLAKVIVHGRQPGLEAALAKTARALHRFRIEGVATNSGFLQALLARPEMRGGHWHTGLIGERMEALVAAAAAQTGFLDGGTPADDGPDRAGARVDPNDPLAVLTLGKTDTAAPASVDLPEDGDGLHLVRAPMQGTIVSFAVAPGDPVRPGQAVAIMEAMKMEHVIEATRGGIVRTLHAEVGEAVYEQGALLALEEADVGAAESDEEDAVDLDHIRPDLAAVLERRGYGLDENRPDAVARRRRTNQRTARENIDDLCDADSFIEYGSAVIAARRTRTPVDELVRRTPADGLVAGIGTVNAKLMPDADTRCMVMSYDYTVLAGTQGKKNHDKKDRMFVLAEQWRLPVVFFTEGGGGRPGDTDALGVAGLSTPAFHLFGRLSGNAPLVGVTSGRCFAGNAALLGSCDVVIATADSTIGMGGPAMIEGGGLGVFRPEEVGPMSVMRRNGVVDIAVEDEIEAVAAARQYLSYFQGDMPDWDCADQRRLRAVVPENRLRVYEIRNVIDLLADTGSVLELRRDFGVGMITALIRIEGKPLGVIANNPKHLGGAIDSEAADKAARFMQLCDAYDLPILSLCDTPGNMVGPEAEKTALVRHCCRLYVIGANVTVPMFTVITRKAYGLGAQAMAAGGFHAPLFTVSWPTGEYGGMGLEGSVKLGFRNELAAIEDPAERLATYEKMVAEAYANGSALNMASHFEIDEVIDPAETRQWVARGLRSVPPPPPRDGKKRPWIDAW